MKVRELIDKLLEYGMDADVVIDTPGRFVNIEDVRRNGGYSGNSICLELKEQVVCERDVPIDGMTDKEIMATPLGRRMMLGD